MNRQEIYAKEDFKWWAWLGHTKISQIELFVSLSTTYLTGLSAEQEAWLESVSYGNISTDWPLLSTNQSGYLMLNVQRFEQLTETANYPYHQAGMPCLHSVPLCAQFTSPPMEKRVLRYQL